MNKSALMMFAMMMAMSNSGSDGYSPGILRERKERGFGQPIPKGLKVFEKEIEAEEGMKCRFFVAAINEKTAGKKFDKLFSDLWKLNEDKGDKVTDEDVAKIKRKHFKYYDYEHNVS